ncbi:hypothetical protein OESDEN_02270 [Oesophagostomum dentatum]|uniref:START domain-containing protein n=1 Tax=Oesophagostomum dentatum TaxID=61180 RepID=A0A0B1TNT4_OESDE|nr:hypothetical protein OESDEN_02270 [Oesophagostomum dentatum]
MSSIRAETKKSQTLDLSDRIRNSLKSTNHTDICATWATKIHINHLPLQYTTSEVVVIKGRDFVVCRMWRKVGDSYVVAATSFENDVPIVAKKKRGWVNVCAGKFTPLATDPTKCTIEYIVSVDLKDKLTPKAVLSSGIADMVIKDARNADKYIEEEKSKKNNS